MSARRARTAFNLLFGVLLPVAPARGAGVEITVSRGLEAMRPAVGRYLLGPEAADLSPAELEPRLLEIAPRIEEFMVSNGPTLERMAAAGSVGQFSGETFARAELDVQPAQRARAEESLDDFQALLGRLESGPRPNAVEIQQRLTVAEALQRYRKHYLAGPQQERLDDLLPRLREARISHPIPINSVISLPARIHGVLEDMGLEVLGGLQEVHQTVYMMHIGFETHPSLLLPAGHSRASSVELLGLAPRLSTDERDYRLSVDVQSTFLLVLAEVKAIPRSDLYSWLEEAGDEINTALLSVPGYLALGRALSGTRGVLPEVAHVLRQALREWRLGDWPALAAILANRDGAAERLLVANRNQRFIAWREDFLHGSAPPLESRPLKVAASGRYIHVMVGDYGRSTESELPVSFTYEAPLDAGAREQALALWRPLFELRRTRASPEFASWKAFAGRMEDAGILPAGYSSRLKPSLLRFFRAEDWLRRLKDALYYAAVTLVVAAVAAIVVWSAYWLVMYFIG